MAIFMTGDTHGDFSRLRPVAFREQVGLTKDDYLIICGDFGGVWDGSEIEQQWLDWLEDRSFTTLFVSGNHENYDLLRSYPTSAWHGGLVQPIRPSVLHLMRGQLYEICGKKIFTMGGAAVTTFGTAFWNQMIRTTSECSGSSTPQALSTESITAPGGKRNCPARTNTGPQEKHWTKQVGTWTTSSPTAAPAAFRAHSAAGCSNGMP